MEHPILPLRDAPALLDEAAVWFSGHWGIPAAEYRESMEQCLRRKSPVPQWYMVRDGGLPERLYAAPALSPAIRP